MMVGAALSYLHLDESHQKCPPRSSAPQMATIQAGRTPRPAGTGENARVEPRFIDTTQITGCEYGLRSHSDNPARGPHRADRGLLRRLTIQPLRQLGHFPFSAASSTRPT